MSRRVAGAVDIADGMIAAAGQAVNEQVTAPLLKPLMALSLTADSASRRQPRPSRP